MTHAEDLRPAHIPGYESDALTHPTDLLDDTLFWLGHLHSCPAGEETEELLLGADEEAALAYHEQLWRYADWPTFTVPLAGGHRIHIVYRTFEDDPGVDYLLHQPSWDQAEYLASDEGHFMGPGLSWPELVAAADNGLPGGSTTDPHARLLLLFPAFGDEDVPEDAAVRLTAALRARTGVDDPQALAVALLDDQGPTGPVGWRTTVHGVRVGEGSHSYRNPANPFALPPDRMARVSAALTP
ncbi:hypothetical protein [Streptomyces sp. NBC_00102]|uniref:hypothetical protein n=1 Tax=Streptomyces sp. NBC_00102 TaxID=2975652 RepID=UPI002254E81F|nr:hypothetical protein [Streptomyces sp. NBC_00102]MCX5396769.1 hypothetical protein [Streptomyces sp. NBC_00102]